MSALRAPSFATRRPTPNNLTVALTSFIGRERELAELKRLLGAQRLITVTGIGGSGKTRLAIEAASAALDKFPDGVWLVELAALPDASLVAARVASVLNVREEPGRALTDTLVDVLREQTTLLLLDNCEHLRATCAQLAELLLRNCPRLKILASSREPLGVAGEQTYPVPTLSVPNVKQLRVTGLDLAAALTQFESLRDFESVRLFVERAVASQPRFALTDQNALAIATVCARLDGIPLAIELAAARVKMLSVQQIAARIDDAFKLLTRGSETALPRQQTLRATMDWSFNLLASEERSVLRRLAVFAGGFTLEATENICAGGDVALDELLDLLSDLVDKSLVLVAESSRDEPSRYRLLETIRQYAQEKLVESGEDGDVRSRHGDFFAQLAELATPALSGAEQSVWLTRLDTEHDNLRAALAWALEADAIRGVKLAGLLGTFWDVRGHLSEGREWLERALAVAAHDASESRGTVLEAAGILAWRQGDHRRAIVLLEENLQLHRQLGDQRGVSKTLTNLGNIACNEGDYARARTLYEEALVIDRTIGNERGLAADLSNLGIVEQESANFARATELYLESLTLRRASGDQRGIAASLNNLGVIAHLQRDFPRALEWYTEALTIARDLGEKTRIGGLLSNLGGVAHALGDTAQARAFHEESLTISQEIGDKEGIAFALEGLANVALAQGRQARAAQLFGAASALREAIAVPLMASEREEYERQVVTVRTALGAPAFISAWTKGRALSTEQAIAAAKELAMQSRVP